MKKRLLYVLIFLLSISLVNASLRIDGPSRSIYNYGDDVKIEGYVFSDEIFNGYLRSNVICSDNNFSFGQVYIHLDAGQKKQFPQELILPKIIVSSSMSGECYVKLSLSSGNGTIEEMSSRSFSITKELDGRFSCNPETIQLGSILKLTGSITKMNGVATSGSAEIYFNSNEAGNYMVDVASFQNGELVYEYTAPMFSNQGTYSIDVLVRDNYGNNEYFSNVDSFKLIKDLSLSISIDKEMIVPGETLSISGEVKNISGTYVAGGNAEITIDDEKYNVNIENGKFSYVFTAKQTIKSGTHHVKVSVQDEYGNLGEKEDTFSINAIATDLVLDLDKAYTPGETVIILPILYDQAGGVIEGEPVTIDVLDPTVLNVYNDVINSGEELELELSSDAQPGNYLIKAEVLDIKKEFKFLVGEVMKIYAKVDNQTLRIMNVGNVKYDKPIEIEINGGEKSLVRKDVIEPGESIEVQLSDELPTGVYNIRVPNAEGKNDFRDVSVTGKKRINVSYIYYGIAIVALILLVLLMKVKKKHVGHLRMKKHRDLKEAENFKRKLGTERVKNFRKNVSTHIEGKKKFRSGRLFGEDEGYVTLKHKGGEKSPDGDISHNPGYSGGIKRKSMDSGDPKPGMFNMFN